MRKVNYLSLLALFVVSACSDFSSIGEELIEEQNDELVSEESLQLGYLRVKFDDELVELLEANTDADGIVTRTSVTRTDDLLSSIGAKYMTRTFPYAGRFEARTRAEGMHLWYELYFDESESVTKTRSELSVLDGVMEVEYRPKMVRIGADQPVTYEMPYTITLTSTSRSSTMPFDDPSLSSQWHYNNTGSSTNQVEGSDINLFSAWESGTVGSSNVIVCVVDGGIEVTHEDLATNIWVNEAEANGTRGVDDDKNGYTDDVNGYSFVINGGGITGYDHGTHVAGTVGAVNNNGIGVGGVAGGNYKAGIAGVRLMSAEIFRNDTDNQGSGATAIKYGADNGAVISQNSWGYETATSVPSSDAAAIDYFVKYAGLDENGNQEGPMAGGVVIFAAGNDAVTYSIPGQYEAAICVTSIGADYKSAYYTNYGDWADITAPGGDYYKGHQVLSTTTGNSYAKMQGTSMAAPHVSGVAALVISKFGGTGFTADELKERLIDYSRDISSYESSMSGKLGGLVDAASALIVKSTVAPNSITTYSVAPNSNSIVAAITVPIDTDEETGKAYGITAYYSKESFTTSLNRTSLPSTVSSVSFLTGDVAAGSTLDIAIEGLGFEEPYYVAFDAYDQSRNLSSMTAVSQVTTGINNPPIIEALDGTHIYVSSYQKISASFKCYDNDGHSVSLSLDAGSDAAVLSSVVTDDVYTVTITGVNAPEGTYSASLTLTDQHSLSTTLDFAYTIRPNSAPEVLSQPEDVVLTYVGAQYTIDLTEVFTDPDQETLTYTSSSSVSTVAHITASSDVLYITALRYGNSDITISAADARGETVTTSFKILVRDPSSEVDLYPNPVTDVLNVRMGDEYTAQIKIYNSAGGLVYSGSNVEISPFYPAQLDLSNLSAGSYTFSMTYDGNDVTRNIVKL